MNYFSDSYKKVFNFKHFCFNDDHLSLSLSFSLSLSLYLYLYLSLSLSHEHELLEKVILGKTTKIAPGQ